MRRHRIHEIRHHGRLQGLSSIPHIYQTLFYCTREFATAVGELVNVSPSMWACAASLLVEWSADVLRHQDVGLERFLHSQRESLYWILDDALLRICADQWDPPQSSPTLFSQSPPSSPPLRKVVPWDTATGQIREALSKAHILLSGWIDQDLEELQNCQQNKETPFGGRVNVKNFRAEWSRKAGLVAQGSF
jgi:hypothetical protein